MYCIFPVLKPLACGRQSRWLAWTYILPRGQKFSIKISPLSIFSPLSIAFPQRRPLNLIKRPGVYKLPGGAIYKPPCVQLINNPVFAIHQVFALASKHKSCILIDMCFQETRSRRSQPPNLHVTRGWLSPKVSWSVAFGHWLFKRDTGIMRKMGKAATKHGQRRKYGHQNSESLNADNAEKLFMALAMVWLAFNLLEICWC